VRYRTGDYVIMGDDRVKKIPWADPWLDKCEVAAINAVLESRWLGMGARVAEFEDKMHQYIGVKHALAVSNGTVALDLALKVLGVGPGDEVIIPAMTYVATAHAVLYQHARPVFADIELKTFNIEPASVERLITKKTKCIIYIDYGGNPADSVGLQEISERHAIPLLQDGAQSLGGGYNGSRLCKQGTISTTSFHIAKLITTIEGGMIFTDDEKIAQDLRMMRNQGEDPQRKYIHRVLGTNARMTDLQAAIGLKQIEKLDVIATRRSQIAQSYYKKFEKNEKIKLPIVREGGRNAWFFVPILVENRDKVIQGLEGNGIETRIAYPMPVYEQPFFDLYREQGREYACPNAKWMTERVINLPIFYSMSDEEISFVADNVMRFVDEYA